MPIPTRSISLREPGKASNIARPTPPGSKAPTRPTTASTPQSAERVSTPDNGALPRARTLLPQRSNLGRDDVNAGQARLPPPESRRPRETFPKRQQQTSSDERSHGPLPSSSVAASAAPAKATTAATPGAAVPTRRQSLMRPAALKVSSTRSNVSAPSKPATSTFAPPSPRKPLTRPPAQSSTPRPPSPKKAEMPPPPRLARSSSLRQPVNSATSTPVAARGHARHRSQMVSASAKAIPPDLAQKPRPGFSTYQQQYTPKKPTTKPPTPTPGDTGPGSSSLMIPTSWLDITALQTELLQLSLFHSSSLERHAEWKAESEAQLREKHNTVTREYRSILGDEKIRQHQLNLQALDHWAQNCREHNGPHGLPEQIQILSQVLQEIMDLAGDGSGGRYTHAVATFENWFEQAEAIRHHREISGILDGVDFIDPLDQSWKEQVRSLHAKLELCGRQLQTLDILGFGAVEQLQQSALARVAQSLMDSIQLMLRELRAMQNVESDLVRFERELVGQLATQLTSLPPERQTVRVGIWKT